MTDEDEFYTETQSTRDAPMSEMPQPRDDDQGPEDRALSELRDVIFILIGIVTLSMLLLGLSFYLPSHLNDTIGQIRTQNFINDLRHLSILGLATSSIFLCAFSVLHFNMVSAKDRIKEDRQS